MNRPLGSNNAVAAAPGLTNRLRQNVSEGLTFSAQQHTRVLPFTLKFLALVIPAILAGHLIDQSVLWLQHHKRLGRSPIVYMAVQTAIWIVLFFVLFKFATGFAGEFQTSVAGIFFVALFFTVQTNYVTNLQALLSFIDKEI